MKKSLIIFMTILVLVTGCGKKEEVNNNDKKNDKANQEVIDANEKANYQESSNSGEDSTNHKAAITEKEDQINQGAPAHQTNPKPSTPTVKLGKNEYISLKDNKAHKYTFTYPDEATCLKLGDVEPYKIVYPVKPYVVFGCEQVKDAAGNIVWGEFFYEHADENSIFYY